MTKMEKERAVFDAVSGIDPVLVQEAAEMARPVKWANKKQRRCIPVGRILWKAAAVAAVLALIVSVLSLWPRGEDYVTGLGTFIVRAYDIEETGTVSFDSVVLEKGAVFTPSVKYDPTKSYRQHFPFSFEIDPENYPGMKLTLEVKTNVGIFYKNDPYDADSPVFSTSTPQLMAVFMQYYGQHFTVDAKEKLFWEPEGFDYAFMEQELQKQNYDFATAYKKIGFDESPSFIDVVIRADEYIVGFCVIAIYEVNIDEHPDRQFSFEMLTMVNYPQVDGRWQKVTEKYVWEQIEYVHSERTG